MSGMLPVHWMFLIFVVVLLVLCLVVPLLQESISVEQSAQMVQAVVAAKQRILQVKHDLINCML